MDFSTFPSKQKRYRDIESFVESGAVRSATVRAQLAVTLAAYRHLMAECWRKQQVAAEDATALASIERDLDSLHNAARLEAQPG